MRLRTAIRGAVQGVGFRPFVFRLATELKLAGWVNNSPQGVFLEVEGPRGALEEFLVRIETEKPPRSFIQSLESSWLDVAGYTQFEIRESQTSGTKTAVLLPDTATCLACVADIFDPGNRRYFYPFTNCTNCGPRFSIIESLPYDRGNTSMKRFTMCPECQREYDDPRNRRFHAQPNACAVCGPHLELWDARGNPIKEQAADRPIADNTKRALTRAAEAICVGKIVAVKGLGGFHLMATACDNAAVQLLRERKHREEKPFALMFPSLESISSVCEVSPLEERLLRSPEAPIVLLRKATGETQVPDPAVPARMIAPSVAAANPCLGVMLPYTPLHHLLMSLVRTPVVATSGNLCDEPICIDEKEAAERLEGIADLFLVHNRPIVRHVDDSILRVMAERPMMLRRARGFAPLPVPISNVPSSSQSVLALGGHLKNSIALSVGPQVFVSQHIGDLETEQANVAFQRVIADFENLYESKPFVIAADAHPDYLSTKFGRRLTETAKAGNAQHGMAASEVRLQKSEVGGESDPSPRPSPLRKGRGGIAGRFSANVVRSEGVTSTLGVQNQGGEEQTGLRCESPSFVTVQHHLAHVLSCMAENEVEAPALGISWDGTGYGLDGTIWGGEFFSLIDERWERVAHFRSFCLPGGDKAIKEPRRAALGVLYELCGNAVFSREDVVPIKAFSKPELASLKTVMTRQINTPKTSSAGRLFDAVASLLGLRHKTRFEGQAAMELEFAIAGNETAESYSLPSVNSALAAKNSPSINSPLSLDWSSLIEGILSDIARGVPAGRISAKFHNSLVEVMVLMAQKAGFERVVLSGGCFQNRYLTERAIQRLQEEGFHPYWHQRVPPNDGGICLGQVTAALKPGYCSA
jgi:hydrogenase maturation protein HypF